MERRWRASVAKIVVRYDTLASFTPDRFHPIPFGQSERTRALLVCLEPGQFIPVHAPGVDIVFVVLEGEGTLVAGEGEAEVGPGAIAFAAAGEARGLRARTRLVAVHVVAPPPTDADHGAVMAGLARGTWR